MFLSQSSKQFRGKFDRDSVFFRTVHFIKAFLGRLNIVPQLYTTQHNNITY